MDKFPIVESITNHKDKFYNSMLLNKAEVSEITDIFKDNRLTFKKEK